MNASALTSLALADPREWTAGRPAARFPARPAATTCGEVYEWFGQAPNQPAIAILDDGGHIAGLVNRLLFLSRYAQRFYPELYARRSILQLANTKPLVVDEAVNIAEPIEEKGALPLVLADRLRLKQILLNLLSNAVKFTPAGGNVWLRAGVDAQRGFCIAIEDTGIGMAPEMIPIALEPFRQMDSPLSRNFEGTGLGLSLVKSLVEAHGGELAIDSALNRGTTVAIAFPASRIVPERDLMFAG